MSEGSTSLNSKQIKGSSSIVLFKKNIEAGPCTALIRDKPGTETPVAIVIHSLHSFVVIKAWFSQPGPLQHTAAIFERDLAAKTLHFVSVGWKPENQFRPKQLGYFLESCQSGIFLCATARGGGSCEPFYHVCSSPPLGSDNPMTEAFISIFHPFSSPAGILWQQSKQDFCSS